MSSLSTLSSRPAHGVGGTLLQTKLSLELKNGYRASLTPPHRRLPGVSKMKSGGDSFYLFISPRPKSSLKGPLGTNLTNRHSEAGIRSRIYP